MAAYRYYRYRRAGRSSPGTLAAAAAAAVVLAGAATAGHGHTGTPSAGAAAPPAVTDDAAAPGSYSTAGWASAFLADAGFPSTACDMSAVEGWQGAEGTYAEFLNPLDSTQREPGSWSVNSVGVQHYTSLAQGLHASVVTLFNGYYPGIIAALRAGDSAQAVADAVAASPWGTGSYEVSC